jgi:NAD(P)-dependent dehydrogenase (short-subunit alcohol dehydrogenase family)
MPDRSLVEKLRVNASDKGNWETMMPTVLITGAGRGFGRELMGVFFERGYALFPLVRDPDVAQGLESAYGAACHPIVADVAADDVECRIASVLDSHGGVLDVLINNAGSIKKLRGLANTAPEDMESLFRVHCVGAFRCTRAALPFLRKAKRALVVNVTSRWGSTGRTAAGNFRGIYSYQIAKCAQNMLSACLDQEFRKEGIRAFPVHPGKLKTEIAAVDADVAPRAAALKFVDWVESVDREQPCGCYDLMTGELIEW